VFLVAGIAAISLQARGQDQAKDGRGLTRSPAPAGSFDPGRKWAVIIGVNAFLDPTIPSLRYCVADAHLVADKLVERCGYDPERILLMTDDQPKLHLRPFKINLQGQVQRWLLHAEPGDTVLVFFAGHGYLDDDRQHFLAPQDCQRGNLGLTGLRTSELREMLRQCKATQKLLVLDCCHAGAKRDVAVGPSSQELGTSFKLAKGLITLSSCSERETSSEWEAKGHGLFTYFLAEGLAGSADENKDGLVDSDELYNYTLDQVNVVGQRELNARLTPVRFIGEDVVGRFALARVASVPPATPAPDLLRLPEVVSNSIGMKLVLIPAGRFMMGSRVDDRDADADEKPQHEVRITRPFYLGVTEVTRGQFRRFVDDTGHRSEAEKDGQGGWGWNEEKKKFEPDPKYTWLNPGFEQSDEHPVVNVSWNDAVAFCEWLSRVDGQAYRLPTEAEWEYACRAGTTTRYFSGDDPESLAAAGNVADGTAKLKYPHWTATITARDGFVYTAPVGQFRPNRFGLYDMHGNVWEWCQDGYDDAYYKGSPGEDPPGASQASARVVRGGGWDSEPRYCRSAHRGGSSPSDRSSYQGFRLARVQSPR
jgi:formylglycine-generating enzyme required for sulfatase activity